MYVVGGFDGKRYFNDIYMLNLELMAWSNVKAMGFVLPRVAFRAAAGNAAEPLRLQRPGLAGERGVVLGRLRGFAVFARRARAPRLAFRED